MFPTYKKAEESFGYYHDKSKFDSGRLNEDWNQTLANHFSRVPDLTLNNFNAIFNEFYKQISKTISQHAPLKRNPRRQRKLLKKSRITEGILISIKKKSSMFKTLSCMVMQTKIIFKRYSNKLTKIKAIYLNVPILNLNCKITKVMRIRHGKFRKNYFLRRENIQSTYYWFPNQWNMC